MSRTTKIGGRCTRKYGKIMRGLIFQNGISRKVFNNFPTFFGK